MISEVIGPQSLLFWREQHNPYRWAMLVKKHAHPWWDPGRERNGICFSVSIKALYQCLPSHTGPSSKGYITSQQYHRLRVYQSIIQYIYFRKQLMSKWKQSKFHKIRTCKHKTKYLVAQSKTIVFLVEIFL